MFESPLQNQCNKQQLKLVLVVVLVLVVMVAVVVVVLVVVVVVSWLSRQLGVFINKSTRCEYLIRGQ